MSMNHDSSAPSCLSKHIYADTTQASGNWKDLYVPGAAGERTVFSSVTRQVISPITEQEQEESNGNSGEGHKEHTEKMTLLGASLLLSLMSSALYSHISWGRVRVTVNAQCCLLKAQSRI